MPMTQDQEATGRAYTQLVTGIIGELARATTSCSCARATRCSTAPSPTWCTGLRTASSRGDPRHHLAVCLGCGGADAARHGRPAAGGRAGDPAARSALAALPQQADRAVVLKVGRHLERAREALGAATDARRAVLVENVTLAQQRVRPLEGVSEPRCPTSPLITVGRRREPGMRRARRDRGARCIAAPGAARRWPSAAGGSLGHAPDCAAARRRCGSASWCRTSGGCSATGVPIVGVCASGILIRALAPLLGDKRDEPPVLAVAEDGSAVVPLLGGHRGANRLARRLAEALGDARGGHDGGRCGARAGAGRAAGRVGAGEPRGGEGGGGPAAGGRGGAGRGGRGRRRGMAGAGAARGPLACPAPPRDVAGRGAARRPALPPARPRARGRLRAWGRAGGAPGSRPRRPGRGRRQPARRRLRRLGRPEGCRACGPRSGRKP